MGSTVKYRKFILPIVVGLIIWALTPIKPDALNDQAWYMFAIFVSTIIACITQPMTIGAVSIIGFTIMILVGIVDTKLPFKASVSSIWLIAMAFFISRGFVKTGLGRRIALQFVKLFGKKRLVWLIHLLVLILSLALLLQVIQHVLVVLCFQSLSLCQSHLVHRRKMALREKWVRFNLY